MPTMRNLATPPDPPWYDLWQRACRFVSEDLWAVELATLPLGRRSLWRLMQIALMAGRGFLIEHQCLLRASALTYTTLLALVPMLAFMFAFLKGLGVQNQLEPLLLDKLSIGSEETVRLIIDYVNRVEAKTLGVIGLVSLLVSTILQLGTIEHTLNEIWGVTSGRTLLRKFTDYFSVTLVAPVVLLLAVTVNAAVQNQALVSTLLETRLIGDALLLMFTLFSYVAVWGIFTFFYTFMPNTPVQIIPASIGGVLGGALWQLAQWAYIDFQVGVSRYHAIYGALAQLPVLMVWIYLSWAIVLLGAEVSCACQRVTLYTANRFVASPSHYAREWLAQALYFSLTRAYLAGAGSWSASAFAQQYRLPMRVLHEVLRPLLVARLLVEDAAAPDHYVPGRDPATLTPWQILQTIRHDDHVGLETVMTCVEPHATGLMTRVEEAVQQVAATRSMTQWLADGEPDGQSEPPTTAAT